MYYLRSTPKQVSVKQTKDLAAILLIQKQYHQQWKMNEVKPENLELIPLTE